MPMLFPQLIKANLKTAYIGHDIQYYQRLPSTNLEAFELIETNDASDGTVIITDQQFQGKGRKNRSWYASPGKAVTFSVILKPNISVNLRGLLALGTGVATSQAIKKFGCLPTLKWPNDILLSKKKCGGILLDTRVREEMIKWAIIGVGINVNEQKKELPEELQSIATTLASEKGSPIQRELLIAWILNALESLINTLKKGEINRVKEAWLTQCDHLDEPVIFELNGKKSSGLFLGINDNGAALIKTKEKKIGVSDEEISLKFS